MASSTLTRAQVCEIGAKHSTATQHGREFTEDGFAAAVDEILASSGRDQLVAALRLALVELGDYGRPSVRADIRAALAAAEA